jgi:hypothetical protein
MSWTVSTKEKVLVQNVNSSKVKIYAHFIPDNGLTIEKWLLMVY